MQQIRTLRDLMAENIDPILEGLSPEDAARVAQEFANAPKDEIVDLLKQDDIVRMLAQPDIKDYGEYKFGEVTIRYKKYMTKKLRRILAVSDRKVKSSDDPLDAQDEAVYSALAEICVDAPWTSSNSWKLVDLKTNDGRIYKIFKDIIREVSSTESNAKSFRAK